MAEAPVAAPLREAPGATAPAPPSFADTLRAAPRRWAVLTAGLALYGLAIALMVRGGRGLGPWDLLHQGLSRVTGVPIGLANVAVGVALLAGLARAGARFGAGTLLNAVGIGVFVDLWLLVVPAPPAAAVGWAMHLAGTLGVGLATGLYLAAAMGAGPRDTLMLVLARRTGTSVRLVRTGIELAVLALGWALGGTVGVGTVVFALGIGPATQLGLRLFARAGGVRPATPAEAA